MIRSFGSEATEQILRGIAVRSLSIEMQNTARRKIRMINNVQALPELRVPPNNRLEKLKGNRAGQFSIRVNRQWRVCFRWDDGDAHEVELTDYH